MNESNIFGISVRGIIAVIVVSALCAGCLYHMDDTKIGILKDLAILILTFYFSQKLTQGGSNATTTSTSSTSPLPSASTDNGTK